MGSAAPQVTAPRSKIKPAVVPVLHAQIERARRGNFFMPAPAFGTSAGPVAVLGSAPECRRLTMDATVWLREHPNQVMMFKR